MRREEHGSAWRDPRQVLAQWDGAGRVDGSLLRASATGDWWDIVRGARITLLVTREYEHLVVAVGPSGTTFWPLPHPSGLVADRERQVVHVSSTRNPNHVFDLAPVTGVEARDDVRVDAPCGRPLVPVRSRFLPGSLYLHDLALVGGVLHANAVGQNAVVSLSGVAGYERVWWPRAIERGGEPDFARNWLQLNSIAAGEDVESSFFTASTDALSSRRPGHRNFPVDRRGVLFSGRTREAVVRGLTRPHSARMHDGRVWLDDSGYGTLGFVRDGRYEPVVALPGWTRGLAFHGNIAFVGTSRILPRFERYAPGLDPRACVCAVHAVDVAGGRVLGSLRWPRGDQIFGIDWMPDTMSTGFPAGRARELFYAFRTGASG